MRGGSVHHSTLRVQRTGSVPRERRPSTAAGRSTEQPAAQHAQHALNDHPELGQPLTLHTCTGSQVPPVVARMLGITAST